ncbi:MAG: hypothetical protein KIT36_02170 [Alphaproteobacteria bacterium]|nr:hypothetical protein [Alphaproteobacteria bacterium]
MRAVLILVLSLGGPAALFFLWAWAVAIKRERRLKGTLPPWQDLPWTNLLIAGLLLAIAGILSLYFFDDRPGGLLGTKRGAIAQPILMAHATPPAARGHL